jgi:hypothetical protein
LQAYYAKGGIKEMSNMKKKRCSSEVEINKSLFNKDMSQSLKNHLDSCPVCRDSALIFHWMKEFQTFSEDKELPAFETIWSNASLTTRVDKELLRKAVKPLIIPRIVSVIIAIVAPIYLVVLNLKGIKALFKSSAESSLIYTSVVSMFNLVTKMSPYLVPAMGIGLLTIIIFTFITGFKPKKRGLFNP